MEIWEQSIEIRVAVAQERLRELAERRRQVFVKDVGSLSGTPQSRHL